MCAFYFKKFPNIDKSANWNDSKYKWYFSRITFAFFQASNGHLKCFHDLIYIYDHNFWIYGKHFLITLIMNILEWKFLCRSVVMILVGRLWKSGVGSKINNTKILKREIHFFWRGHLMQVGVFIIQVINKWSSEAELQN